MVGVGSSDRCSPLGLGDSIEITKLGASQELLPLADREFADWRLWIACVADHDNVTKARNTYTLPSVASTRDKPSKFRHENLPLVQRSEVGGETTHARILLAHSP